MAIGRCCTRCPAALVPSDSIRLTNLWHPRKVAPDSVRMQEASDATHRRQARSDGRNRLFYTTMKNQETTTKKLELRKCDPRIRKHVVCTEGKA